MLIIVWLSMRVLNPITEILPLPPVVPQKKIIANVTKSIETIKTIKTYRLSKILKCKNCPRTYVNLKYYYKHIESCLRSKEKKSVEEEC
uniref:Uncharacterized protein n=1 Tax=Phlebotomus papatasi TaxID=29031 RepID=A0A1B0D7D9_PHLPP